MATPQPPASQRKRRWWRPPVEGFPLELRAYALRLHGFLLITGGAWLGFTAWHLVRGHRKTTALAAAMLAAVVVIERWMRRQHRSQQLRDASQLVVATATVGLVVLAMLSGQGRSLALWYLAPIPLYVAYQEGEKMAAVWAGIALGLTTAVHASELLTQIPPEFLIERSEEPVAHVSLLLMLAAFGLIARHTHDDHVRQLRDQQRDSRSRSQALTASLGQANEATRAQSRFLASMSHEIRTPLNGMLGLTEVLRGSDLPPSEREMVGIIHKSGRHLLDVLNNILDYAKLDAQNVEILRAPYSVVGCIEDVLDLLAPVALEQGLDLASDLDPSAPGGARGDATRVRQVLLNLATNALKFTREGSVVLGVRVEGNQLVYEVRDTGPGLTQAEQDQLFQPFRQTVTSQRSRFDLGSGLGLVISRRLAELMGGKLTLQSQVGRGTTFSLWLPLVEASDQVTQPVTLPPTVRRLLILESRDATARSLVASAQACAYSPRRVTIEELAEHLPGSEVLIASMMPAEVTVLLRATARENPVRVMLCLPPSAPALPSELVALGALRLQWPASRRQLRRVLLERDLDESREPSSPALRATSTTSPLSVLVAEDNSVNRLVMERTLRRLGHEPDFAVDGLSAVEAAARRNYDLILMDVQMPVLDGLSATRRIRQELNHQPRIVAVTASVLPEQQEACRRAGMDGFLRKPFEVAELTAVLQNTPTTLPPPKPSVMFDPAKFEQLRDLVDNDRSELSSLVQEYETNTRQLQQQMRESLPNQRVQELCRAAHTLKSSSALMGASGLSSLCASLEEATRQGQIPADAAARIEAIDRAGAESFRWLQEQIG